MTNKIKCLQVSIGSNYTDFDTVVLPYEDNCMDYLEGYAELREKWLSKEFLAYGEGQIKSIKVVYKLPSDIGDNLTTVRCEEFNIYCFKSLAIPSELYSTPYDNCPELGFYSCYFAYECMQGRIYSKDFAYFECPECGRIICEQNPSNGWNVQMREYGGEGEYICTRCFDAIVLKEGINDIFDKNSGLPGNWFTAAELEKNNWTAFEESICVGSGYSDYSDPAKTLHKIQDLIDEGVKVLVAYESMAIGGLGGYISIYTK